jgi:pimeloyl-ACP methyl ester carboxylesterase
VKKPLAWLTAVVVTAAASLVAPGPAAWAARSDCDGVEPVATAPAPHSDGKYTPIVLVHGFLGGPSMWTEPARYSVFGDQADGFALMRSLGGLPGAAVYAVDYRIRHTRWFANDGGGGDEFLRVADCVLGKDMHAGHQLVVVGHSMGGLIARWAMTDAPGAHERRARAGLMISLGTPYEGSQVAVAADFLAEAAQAAAARTPQGRAVLTMLHLVAAACDRLDRDDWEPCQAVQYLLDLLATVKAFKPGSPELSALSPWPAELRVHTLTSNTVLSDTQGLFRKRTVTADVGDLVVSQQSATSGDRAEKVAECRYTMDGLTAGANAVLERFGMRLNDDPAGYFLLGLLQGCLHTHQAQLVELTAEVVALAATELSRYEPVYAYRTASGLGIVHTGSPEILTVDGSFSGLEFTADGGHLLAVEWPGEARAQVVAIDATSGERRSFPCGGCVFAVGAGGSRAAWLQDGTVMLVDVIGSGAPQAQPHRMPPPASTFGLDAPRLVAFANELAYVEEDMAPGASVKLGSVTVLDASGGAHRLETDGSVGQVAHDGSGTVAYGSFSNSDSCRYRETVRVVTGTGESMATDVSGLRQFDGNTVDDLWWGRDGKLYATMASWRCFRQGSRSVDVVPSSLWRLDGSTWVSVDAGPLAAVRQLSQTTKAVQLLDGSLYTEVSGNGNQVASGVTWIAAPHGMPDPQVVPPGTPLPPANPAFEPYVGHWQAIEDSVTIDGTYHGRWNYGGAEPGFHAFELGQEGDRVVAVFDEAPRSYLTPSTRWWLYLDGRGHLYLTQNPDDRPTGYGGYCDEDAIDTNPCW